MFRLWACSIVVGLLVAVIPSVCAGPHNLEGLISSLNLEERTLTARAVDYENITANTKVKTMSHRLDDGCVVTLDGRLVVPEVAIVPGRWFYAFGRGSGLQYIAVLSETVFTPEGVVTKVAADGRGAVVQLALGSNANLDLPVTFDTAQQLSTGLRIRVEPGRTQTIRVFTEVPRNVRREAFEAVVKSSDGEARCVLRLRKGTAWEDREINGPKLPLAVVDARFKSMPLDAFAAGRYGVHVANPSAFITVLPETGRVDGLIAEVRPTELVVATIDGPVKVAVDATAAITRDGKQVALGELHAGLPVLVLPPRAQRVKKVAPSEVRAFMTLGPYVQNTSESAATVMWFTENAAPGAVRYGVKHGEWLGTVTGPVTNAHAVAVTGLQPATKYFYEVLDGVRPLAGGPTHYFETHPKTGSRTRIRFMAAGDMGGATGLPWVKLVTRSRPGLNFGLLLGDLAYETGSHRDYLDGFFPAYGDLMRNFCLWATPGDNDFKSMPHVGHVTFFQYPTNELPKVEGVFSFDYANAHFMSLGDGCGDGMMISNRIAWARRDLDEARHRGQKWFIAVNHRPPHGGKDGLCPDLVELLEAGGADVLLSGHSHFYKRTHLVRKGKVVQQNDASQYTKKDGETGTLYIIAGTGGRAGSPGNQNEPLTAFRLGKDGMLLIEIEGDMLTGQFIGIDDKAHDVFHLRKVGP